MEIHRKRVREHSWCYDEVPHALVKEEKIGTLPNVEVIDEIWGILVDLLFHDQDIVVHLGQTDWTGGCGFRCVAVRSAGGLCVTIPVLNVHCVVLSLLDATIYSRVAWIGFNVGVGIIRWMGFNVGVGIIACLGFIRWDGQIFNIIIGINCRKAGEAVFSEFGSNVRRTI